MPDFFTSNLPFCWSPVHISRREWTIAGIIAVVMASLMILPYLLGHWTAPPDTVFTGLLINVEDGSYLSAIEQGGKEPGYIETFSPLSPTSLFLFKVSTWE